MVSLPPFGVEPTEHYFDRCWERGIPERALDVAVRFGERLPGKHPGEILLYVSPLVAWRHQLWDYECVAVVVADGAAVTVYRMSEETARRRRAQVLS